MIPWDQFWMTLLQVMIIAGITLVGFCLLAVLIARAARWFE